MGKGGIERTGAASLISRAGPLTAFLRANPWREAAAAGLVVTAIAMIPLLFNGRFYFNDDFQSYFMPMFREIARLLLSGEVPLSSPKIWFGGAIAGEYQYAVFHPVCLLLYLIIHQSDNLAAGAAIYALVHMFILGTGIFALCRHLGCTFLSALAGALIACTSSWMLYWGASSWIPALVSQAWLAWAVYFLLRAGRSGKWFVPAVVTIAFTLLSGWPFAILALLFTLLVLFAVAAWADTDAGALWRGGLAVLSGGLLAMPAILPAAAYMAESAREFVHSHEGSLTLNGLLSFGVPSAAEIWTYADQRYSANLGVQQLYASMVIPVALAVGGWAVLWRTRRAVLCALILLAAGFGIATMLPNIWQFQWFSRMLPWYHSALGILAALLLSHVHASQFRNGALFFICCLAVLVPFIIPVSIDSGTYGKTAVFLGAAFIFLYLIYKASAHGASAFRGALIGGHIFILVMMILIWPRNFIVPQWDYPATGVAGTYEREARPRRLALYKSLGFPEQDPGEEYWSHIALGNTAVLLDAETINGYSPPRQGGLTELFCLEMKGGTCFAENVDQLFTPVWKGVNLLDLAGVEEVATESPGAAKRFAAAAGSGWKIVAQNDPYTVFLRRKRMPGFLVAPDSKGIDVEEAGRSARRVVYDVRTNPDFSGAGIVIRRPWYPGVHARLNGKPIRAETIHNALPLVRLPAGAEGRLTVGYWPQGLSAGLLLAGLGLLILGCAVIRPRTVLTAPEPFARLWIFLTTRTRALF